MSIRNFNIFCVVSIGFFSFGTAYLWYEKMSPERADFDPGIELTEFYDFQEEKNVPKKNEEVIRSTVLEDTVKDEEKDAAVDDTTPNIPEKNDIQLLPKEINLDVPFTSQAPEKNWEQPWQDACEEAAVLMMDAYYKNYDVSPLFAKDEILKMVAWEEQKGWGESIGIERVSQLVEYYMGEKSLKSREHLQIIENPKVEEMKASLALGHPILVVANGKILPNPNFRGDGPVYHALIIRGYTEEKFITNDPGTQFGKNFLYSYEDLMNAIADWNGGEVVQGRKVILMFK